MALLFEPGQSLDAMFSVLGLGEPGEEQTEVYHTQQTLQEIQAWWDLWNKYNQNVTFEQLVQVAESLKPRAYPESGGIFLRKVRDIWLTKPHIKSIMVRSSCRPVLGQEGENRSELVKALALSLSSLPKPTSQQQNQKHNTSQLQFWGSTHHVLLYLSIKPTSSFSSTDIQLNHLCVYHDRPAPLHRQYLDDLQELLNKISILNRSTWKRFENSVLTSHLFKRISQWIVAHHSRSSNKLEACIEFVREKRVLRVNCKDSILVNVGYAMEKSSDTPSMSNYITTQKFCRWCSTRGCNLQCGRCKKVWYCNKQCQTLDYPNHKKMCKNSTHNVLDHYNNSSWKNVIHEIQQKLERGYKPSEGKSFDEEIQAQQQPGLESSSDKDEITEEDAFYFYVHRQSLSKSAIYESLKAWNENIH